MKNASLLLVLLVGLFSGHADSGEKTIAVPPAAETPGRCWCAYNVTNSKPSEESTSYEMEEVTPLRSGMERGEPDFIPTSDQSALSYDGLDAFSNKNLIHDAVVYSIPLLPPWKLVADANTCGYCAADRDDVGHVEVEEDLIYHVVHALQQSQNAYRKARYNGKQPPLHAWEREEEMQAAK